MSIKKIVSVFVFLFPFLVFAQTVQPCVVKQYNHKDAKTPLAGVQVEVRGANTVVSDKKGAFELKFNSNVPGDRVVTRRIEKEGYEVFNTSALEQWVISRDKIPFQIVLVRSDYMAQLKSSLKNSSIENYKAKYEQAKRDLRAEKEAGKLKEAEFLKKMEELENQYDRALTDLNNYIDRFARFDLSEIDTKERHILEMVQRGQIDEAVKAYEALNISEKLLNERQDLKELEDASSRIEKEKEQKKANINSLKQSLDREITTLKLAGGQENFEKIGQLLKEQALADTSDFENIFRYAGFLLDQCNYKEAKYYLLICLKEINNNIDVDVCGKAVIYRELGELYSALFLYEPASFYYHESIWLCEQDTETCTSVLVEVENQLALQFLYQRKIDSAEYYFRSALQMLEKVEDSVLNDMYLSSIQHNLGVLYRVKNDYELSERYLLSALKNKERLYQQDSSMMNLTYLTSTQELLGLVYGESHQYNLADSLFALAVSNHKKLFDYNPDVNRGSLVNLYMDIAKTFDNKEEYKRAEPYYEEALNHARVLMEQDSTRFRLVLANLLRGYGMNLLLVADYPRAEKCLLESLEQTNIIFQNDSVTFRKNQAGILEEVGQLYLSMENFQQAEFYFLAAFRHASVLSENAPDEYLDLMTVIQNGLGSLYFNSGDYFSSAQYYSLAQDNCILLVRKNPSVYRDELAKIQFNYGSLCYFMLENDTLAERLFVNSLDNFMQLYEQGRRQYLSEILDLYNNLSLLYARNNNFNKALETIDKSIEIYPADPNAYDTKGEILLMLGKEKEALEMWMKVLELDENFLLHLRQMGIESNLYLQLKEKRLVE